MLIPAKRKAGAVSLRWFSTELKRLLRKKNFAHRKLKKSGIPYFEMALKRSTLLAKKQHQTDYLASIKSLKDELERNPKNMFRHAKFRQGKRSKPPLNIIETNCHSPPEISGAFASHFMSV